MGKSTLFNALTAHEVEASNYPFCTIDPNVGVVEVPDHRLQALSEISKSKKLVPAAMEFVDIAGLVAGASKGEGLGNKFLANIRETDAILHVVRCFEDGKVVGEVDPIGSIEIINLELILADLQMAQNALEKVRRQAKGKKEMQAVVEALEAAVAHLDKDEPLRTLDVDLGNYNFLTRKKVLYVCNTDEAGENELVEKVRAYARAEGNAAMSICAKIEAELAQLDEADQIEFLKDLGQEEPGLNRLIRASFEMLGLINFLTTGEQETRAWPILKGTSAPAAAGTIHTDLEKGFIRAEVLTFDDFVHYGGRGGAKEAGKLRSEGKEYIVQDGDVVLFLHN